MVLDAENDGLQKGKIPWALGAVLGYFLNVWDVIHVIILGKVKQVQPHPKGGLVI